MDAYLGRRLRFTNQRTGNEFTCGQCRQTYGDDGECPPCDRGGLAACPYWRTHDASPGEPVEPWIVQALQLAQTMQQHGWDFVRDWQTWEVTDEQAERLSVGIQFFTDALPQVRQTWQQRG